MTKNGQTLRPKVAVSIERGDVLELRTAGGGGCGQPVERDPELLQADVRDGIVSPAAASGTYRR